MCKRKKRRKKEENVCFKLLNAKFIESKNERVPNFRSHNFECTTSSFRSEPEVRNYQKALIREPWRPKRDVELQYISNVDSLTL